nr:CRISPR-associated endonuclease Cas2 [uncultured Cohaesibacter sp.]
MAGRKQLIVFTYDVSKDRIRTKIADILERQGIRVQYSVFECRMDMENANALFSKLELLIDPEDSIRMYVIPEDGREKSRAFGGAPISEAQDFYLL